MFFIFRNISAFLHHKYKFIELKLTAVFQNANDFEKQGKQA